MFRRKSARARQEQETGPAPAAEVGREPGAAAEPGQAAAVATGASGAGPYDVDDLVDDKDRVDVGALLIPPVPGREIRLQVQEKTNEISSVLVIGPEGAMELQAFSAPRNGDLWSEVRPQLAADVTRRGGRTAEREGRFGVELLCQLPVKQPDGQTGVQPSRVIGVNGPRWMLRATVLGRPAMDHEALAEWEEVLVDVAVRRGDHAMPVGRPLPFKMPDGARKMPDAARKAPDATGKAPDEAGEAP